MKITVSQKNLPDWSGEVLAMGLVEGGIENQLEILDRFCDLDSLYKYRHLRMSLINLLITMA